MCQCLSQNAPNSEERPSQEKHTSVACSLQQSQSSVFWAAAGAELSFKAQTGHLRRSEPERHAGQIWWPHMSGTSRRDGSRHRRQMGAVPAHGGGGHAGRGISLCLLGGGGGALSGESIVCAEFVMWVGEKKKKKEGGRDEERKL